MLEVIISIAAHRITSGESVDALAAVTREYIATEYAAPFTRATEPSTIHDGNGRVVGSWQVVDRGTGRAPVMVSSIGGWDRPASVSELHSMAQVEDRLVDIARAEEWRAYDAGVCMCHDTSAYRPTHPRRA